MNFGITNRLILCINALLSGQYFGLTKHSSLGENHLLNQSKQNL